MEQNIMTNLEMRIEESSVGNQTVRETKYADYTIVENWFDEEGRLHRAEGLPAVVGANGEDGYYIHGKCIAQND